MVMLVHCRWLWFQEAKKEQHFKYSAMSLQALLPQVMCSTGALTIKYLVSPFHAHDFCRYMYSIFLSSVLTPTYMET